MRPHQRPLGEVAAVPQVVDGELVVADLPRVVEMRLSLQLLAAALPVVELGAAQAAELRGVPLREAAVAGTRLSTRPTDASPISPRREPNRRTFW